MNYFFFLDHPDKSLEPSIELYNRAPMDIFFKEEKNLKYIYLFYVDNQSWHNELFGSIEYNKSLTIKKSDLNEKLRNKTIFASMTSKKLNPNQPPFNDDTMKNISIRRIRK